MQAEIVQWEKSAKAECIFYIDVIRHQKSFFVKEVTGYWIDFIQQGNKYSNKKAYQKS